MPDNATRARRQVVHQVKPDEYKKVGGGMLTHAAARWIK
jgi:hypothetical protein